MAFWKKCDDPWDVNPEKRKRTQAPLWEQDPSEEAAVQKPAAGPEGEGLGELLGNLFKQKEEEPIPAEKCPWCGGEMDVGYLTGGQEGARWQSWKPMGLKGLFPPSDGEYWSILTERNGLSSFQTAWYCRACEKIVFHAPQSSSGPNYVWENGRVKQPGPEEADIPGDEDWSANPKAYGACREQMEHRKTKENE